MEISLREDTVPSFVDAYKGTVEMANCKDNATSDDKTSERLPWGGGGHCSPLGQRRRGHHEDRQRRANGSG